MNQEYFLILKKYLNLEFKIQNDSLLKFKESR